MTPRKQVAELMPDDICRKILNAGKINLQQYIVGMSSEDLKRDSKSALFGAMDHVRCVCVCFLFFSFLLRRQNTNISPDRPVGPILAKSQRSGY